jgi:O-antigen ligase
MSTTLTNIIKLPSSYNTLDKYLWWGMLAFLASLMFSIAIVQIVVGVLGILWITKIIRTPGYRYKHTPIDYAYLGFIGSRVLAILFSVNIALSLQGFNREIIFYVLFFIAVDLSFISEKDQLKKLLWVLIGAAVLVALYGTGKVILGIESRASSSTGGYITLGMLLTVVLALALGLGREKSIFPSRLIWGIVIFILCCGILFTLNRSHWIIAAVTFFIVGIRQERRTLGISILIAAVAIIAVPPLRERFMQLLLFTQYTSNRDVVWQGAFMIFFDRPVVGFGLRTFTEIFPLYNLVTDKFIGSWHCDYLQVYMEGGLIGLSMFLWFWATVFVAAAKVLKGKFADPFYQNLVYSILLAMIAFALNGIWGGFVTGLLSTLLFEFLLAVLAAIAMKTKGIQ